MKKQIASREDLVVLMEAFYRRLLVDEEIGHFFTRVVHLDLERHLPRLVDFWESVLFQSGGYAGDPMAVHIHLNGLHALTGRDFEVWLGHFEATVDGLYEGEVAERAKQRARSIAMLMQIKIQRTNS
jgi:hemoglobin